MSKYNVFINKYFDYRVYVPIVDDQKKQELYSNIISKLNFNEDDLHKIGQYSSGRDYDSLMLSFFNKLIMNIRLYKIFKKTLTQNMEKCKDDIFHPDIFLMSLLETTNQDLYKKIELNNEYFCIWEYYDVDVFAMGKEKLIGKQTYISHLLNGLSTLESEILFIIFPNVKILSEVNLSNMQVGKNPYRKQLSQFLDNIESNQRLAHPLLFELFFQYSSTEEVVQKITNKNYKSEIINLAKKDSKIDELVNHLKKLFPVDGRFYNHRLFSLNWVNRIVKNENKQIAKNVIIGLSIIAKDFDHSRKNFLQLPERKRSSLLVLNYFEKTNGDTKLFFDLLDQRSSDSFASVVVFYTINDDRRPGNISINNDIKEKICEKYLKRIYDRIAKGHKLLNNSTVFDDYAEAIWRWKDAQYYLSILSPIKKFNINIEDHLFKEISETVDQLMKFLGLIVSKDPVSGEFRINSETIINKHNIVSAIDHHLSHNLDSGLKSTLSAIRKLLI